MKRFLKILLFIIIAAGVAIGSVLTIRAVNNRGAAPVGWWKMDEGQGQTAYDASGNGNNGTLGASTSDTTPDPTWKNEESCKNGKCLNFDGTDDYVQISGNPDLLSGSRTYELWFYPHFNSDSGGVYGMFGSYVDGSNTITLYNYSNGFYGVAYKAGGSANYVSAGTFTANNWYHIAFTFDDDTNVIKVYHNGVFQNQDTESNAMAAGTVTTLMGEYVLGTTNFDGLIDDVRVYNYARTAAQIKADYNKSAGGKGASVKVASLQEQQNASDGLVGYWKMDEASWAGAAGEVVDSSGNGNNGTAVGGASTTSPAKFGRAGSFDGGNDYADVGDNTSLDITNAITVEAWAKTNNATRKMILGKYTSGYDGEWYIDVNMDVGSGASFNYILGPSSRILLSHGSGGDYSDGEWHHFVGTFGSDGGKFYIDGIQVNSDSTTGNIFNTDDRLLIGAITSGYNFNGSIDDVKIYNKARSAEQIQRDYETGPPPIMHLRMDENSGQYAYDTSSTNNGMLGSSTSSDPADPVWSDGKYGSALKFDGADDYVALSSPLTIGSTSNTVSMWVKIPSTVTDRAGIGLGNYDLLGSPNSHWDFTTVAKPRIYWNNQELDSGGQGAELNDDKWHNTAWVRDKAQNKFFIYVDGVLIYTGNSAGSDMTFTTVHYIGADKRTSGAQFFNGPIDDVRIYNYARTQKQIMEDMNAGHPASVETSAGNASIGRPGSYAGYWNFDEGNGDTAYDKSVNANNGDLYGSCPGAATCPTWTTDGKFGKALSFDGGDYVSIPDSSSLVPANFSVSFWAKPGTMSDWARWMGKDSGLVSGRGFFVVKYTADEAYFLMLDANSVAKTSPRVSYTVNEWTFFSFTFDGTYIRAYKNGVEITPATNVGAWVFATSTQPFKIGTSYDNFWYQGSFDEVKIYPFALSPAEIKEEFNRGSSLKLGASSTASDGVTPSESQERSYCVPGDVSDCAAPVAHWKMDEAQAQYAYDTSGNANTGTLGTGNTADASDPQWKYGDYCKTGACLQFDGTDDYVNAGQGSSLNGLTSMTLSAWIKPYGYSSNYRSGIISRRRGSGAYEGLNFDMGGALEVPYRLALYESGGGAGSFYANTVISPNQWSFVTATLSGTDGKIYINGVLDASGTLSWNWSSDVDVLIGMVYPGYYEYNFNGLIDDVRIYNYARTPAQIAWDYNRGAPVAHWKMNDGQDTATTCDGTGTVVKDSSGNANTGTLTLGASPTPANAWSEGKYGCGITFDGSDDYVKSANNSGFSGDITATISAWVKFNSLASEQFIVMFGEYTNSLGGMTIDTNVNGAGSVSVEFFGNNGMRTAAGVVSTGQWYHIVATKTAGAINTTTKLYINGISQNFSVTSANTPNITNLPVNIGRGSGVSNEIYGPFNGLIDDVRIYNYALTPLQIKTLFNEGSAVRFGPTEGLP